MDDDFHVRQLISSCVQELTGMEVDVAADGGAALLKIEANPNYSLILLDMMLPGMDGFQVIELAKQRHASIPILALSAGEFRRQALLAGADDYLAKPFDLQTLADKLARWASPPTTPCGQVVAGGSQRPANGVHGSYAAAATHPTLEG